MGAVVTKYVTVKNTLFSYIHVVMDLRSIKDFRDSDHVSQVIPPGGTAKFPVRLMCSEVSLSSAVIRAALYIHCMQ